MSSQVSWTEAPEDEAGGILTQYARALQARMETRMTMWEICAAIYNEQLQTSLRPSRARSLSQPSAARNANVTFNLARSLVETEHATITEALPRPTFLTEDGNQPQQDLAEELQRAVDGVFSDLRGYDVFKAAELDKGVFGTGVVKTHHVAGRPALDRVLICDMLIDEELMGRGDRPQQAIHYQEVSRAAMLVWFKDAPPALKRAIKEAPAVVASNYSGMRADLIAVFDAYSLPLDEDNPGRHMVAIENCDRALFSEPWDTPRLPFQFLRWQKPRTGFYGIGIIEQVLGIQTEINRFYRNISQALKNWGVPTLMHPNGAKINLQQWTNDPRGKLVPFEQAGGLPTLFSPQVLTPEVMEYLNFCIDNGYKVTGIPQNAAFAQREQGIPSAAGQREISQKGASRLSPQSQEYEQAFVDCAWCIDDVIRKLKAQGEQLTISTADQGALHSVDIDRAITLKPGTYKIDVFAGNFLSRHPASKRQEVAELAQAGVFSPEEVRALTNMPDITAALGKPIDVRGIYQKQIKNAVTKGIYVRPEAFFPQPQLGVKLYAEALFEGMANGMPEDRQQVLRNWIVAMRDVLAQSAPPAQDAPPPQQPAPAQGQAA